jgi:hypothetical protein
LGGLRMVHAPVVVHAPQVGSLEAQERHLAQPALQRRLRLPLVPAIVPPAPPTR